MTQAQLQTTINIEHHKQARERALYLRARVDKLREKITKTIGSGFDVVRAIREIRQER